MCLHFVYLYIYACISRMLRFFDFVGPVLLWVGSSAVPAFLHMIDVNVCAMRVLV